MPNSTNLETRPQTLAGQVVDNNNPKLDRQAAKRMEPPVWHVGCVEGGDVGLPLLPSLAFQTPRITAVASTVELAPVGSSPRPSNPPIPYGPCSYIDVMHSLILS